jgi:o-succinylbenzoate---CoA ligase
MDRARLIDLVRATGCVEEHGGHTFLCDPLWGPSERAQLRALQSKIEKTKSEIEHGWLCVPTGGTSGQLKFARHDEQTLTAAARGFCQHFDLERVNAVDVLPAHHVSGLLARVRCADTGGEHVAWSWKKLESGERPALASHAEGCVLSLVPTQLGRLLASGGEAANWLRQFHVVLLGGGPLWPALAEAAAAAQIPVALSYGMTETAAMIAAQRPGDFARGERDAGRALPHGRVEIVHETSGAVLPAGEIGLVRVSGASLFRGYVGQEPAGASLLTQDFGSVEIDGRLRIHGRRDAVIITGGKKVFPEDVEQVLRTGAGSSEVVVVGVPDPEWGARVIACYPAGNAPDLSALRAAASSLAAHKRPKEFVAIASWPANAAGKVNRAELVQRILTRA